MNFGTIGSTALASSVAPAGACGLAAGALVFGVLALATLVLVLAALRGAS